MDGLPAHPRVGSLPRGLLRGLPLLLPWALCLATGLRGVDFGVHWDEHRELAPIARMAESGTLLPGDYHYPSLSRYAGLAAAVPEILGDEPPAEALQTRAFRLRWRALFLVLSSLAVPWVYLAVLGRRGSVPEALFAAGLLASSWEVAYHLRWTAPDGLLLQLGALTLAAALAATERRSRAWARLAAVAAGLACGAKYTGALLLVPALLAGWAGRPRGGPWLRPVLGSAGLFAAAYLLSTPGTLLEPGRFARDLAWEIQHYRGGHGSYTVAPGLEYWGLALEYLGLVLFARSPALALVPALLAAAGAVALVRRRPLAAAIAVGFPLLYLFYLGLHRVLIVRNLLPVAPFLALLAARGAAVVAAARAGRTWRVGWAAGLAVLLAANAVALVRAAESVADRGSARFVAELADHLAGHPELRFRVSPGVARALAARGGALPPNATPGGTGPGEPADRVVLYASEGPWWLDWPANRRGLALLWFGPREVNFNYYPSWQGDDRILVLDAEVAREIGLAAELPVDGEALFAQAFALQEVGELEEAIARYRRFLALQPDHSQAHFNLAHALMERGRHAQAVESFLRCLELRPDYAEVHLHLARCYAALGQPERAEAHRRRDQ